MSTRVRPHLFRGRGAGALLFALVTLAFVVAPPAPVGAVGINGKIAMRCLYDICTANPDGTDLKVITTGYEPDWSPDGKLIVFVWGDGRDGELATVRADGSHYRRLTRNSLDERFPEFSPDGSRIAFSCGAQICWMNADGSNRTKITSHPGWAEDPGWAPSGDELVFTGNKDDLYAIYTIALDGSSGRTLISPGPADKSPSWSPNGKRIAFIHGAELMTVHPDGTNLKALTETQDGLDAAPAWSPDSRQVAYAHADPEYNEDDPPYFTYTVGRDGAHITQVSDELAYWVGQLSWARA